MSNGSEHLDERCVHAVDGPDWAGLRELNNAEVDYKALVKQARGFVPIMESGNLILALADAVEAWLAIEQRLTDHIVQLAAERDALVAENAQLRGDLSENRRALDDAIKVANGNKSACDALLAENEKHRADLHEWETVGAPAWVAAKDAQLAEVWAERDALQARLDVMTVEWEYGLVNPDARRGQYGRDDTAHLVSTNREHIERQHKHGHPSIQFVRRIKAGPWTVVPEEGK